MPRSPSPGVSRSPQLTIENNLGSGKQASLQRAEGGGGAESCGGSTEAPESPCQKARRPLHVTITETTTMAPFLFELLSTLNHLKARIPWLTSNPENNHNTDHRLHGFQNLFATLRFVAPWKPLLLLPSRVFSRPSNWSNLLPQLSNIISFSGPKFSEPSPYHSVSKPSGPYPHL